MIWCFVQTVVTWHRLHSIDMARPVVLPALIFMHDSFIVTEKIRIFCLLAYFQFHLSHSSVQKHLALESQSRRNSWSVHWRPLSRNKVRTLKPSAGLSVEVTVFCHSPQVRGQDYGNVLRMLPLCNMQCFKKWSAFFQPHIFVCHGNRQNPKFFIKPLSPTSTSEGKQNIFS